MKSTKNLNPGDTLYRYNVAGTRELFSVAKIEGDLIIGPNGAGYHIRCFQGRIKPKVPRLECWMNLYANYTVNNYHPTKERADINTAPDRIRCVHLREVRKKGE